VQCSPARLPRSTRPTRKRRIQFIKAQSSPNVNISSTPTRTTPPTGDAYLARVLPSTTIPDQHTDTKSTICEICNLPLSLPSSVHETSIAHQICLTHTHPPLPLDRRRKGLVYLESYGWDPESRTGLGAAREGRLFPVKAVEKKDRAGIGAPALKKKEGRMGENEGKLKKLNAKQIAKMEKEDRKVRDRLQRMFYSSQDLEKYLGPDG